jgi:hypothetical protein
MRGLFVAAMCICLNNNSLAQEIVINAPERPAYSYVSYMVDSIGIDEGSAGTGITWDFRNTRIMDSGSRSYITKIENLPFKEIFPSANYAISTDQKNYINFLYKDDNVIGSWGDVNFYKDVVVRTANGYKMDTLIEYPMYYRKKKGFREYRHKEYRKSDSIEAEVRYITFSAVDGSGTLITPDGRVYKALRLKVNLGQESKVYKMIGDRKVYQGRQLNTIVHYRWYCPDDPYVFVFSITKDRVEREGPYIDNEVYKTTLVNYFKPSNVYANPDFNSIKLLVTKDMVNKVQVAYSCREAETGVIQLIDMRGTTILKTDVVSPERAPVENSQELNTAELAPGMYIITYTSEKERGVVKWVKK